MKNYLRLPTLFLVLFFFLTSHLLQAQVETVQIKEKKTLIIPKIDAYWSTVVVVDDFPTFFPLELEINLPAHKISFNAILSPWASRFSTQTQTTNTFTLINGFGLRYYFYGKESQRAAATGLFVEPQMFFRFENESIQEVGGGMTNTSSFESAFMVAGGYQHLFGERVYVQGRLSVGLANSDFLNSYEIGRIMVLPWIGIGIRLN